jgi:hypothetical protein
MVRRNRGGKFALQGAHVASELGKPRSTRGADDGRGHRAVGGACYLNSISSRNSSRASPATEWLLAASEAQSERCPGRRPRLSTAARMRLSVAEAGQRVASESGFVDHRNK